MISRSWHIKPVITAFVLATMAMSNVQASTYQCIAQFTTLDAVKKDIKKMKEEQVKRGETPHPDVETALLLEYMTEQYYKTIDSVTDYSTTKEMEQYDSNVKYHTNANEAFSSIIHAIENAKYTIDLTYYIFARDDIGFTILQKVQEAHRRGVKIRVMVDSLGSPHPFHGELKSLLSEKGGQMRDTNGELMFESNGKPMLATVEVKVFQPIINVPVHLELFMAKSLKALHGLPVAVMDKLNDLFGREVFKGEGFRERFATYEANHQTAQAVYSNRNRRSHDKIMLIDGQHPNDARFFTGGRNMAVPYYGIPKVDDKTFHDLTVEIRPLKDQVHHVGLEVMDYYNKLYYHLANKNLSTWFLAMKLSLYQKNIGKMNTTAGTILDPNTDVGKKYLELKSDVVDGVNGFAQGFKTAAVRLVDEIENISRKHAVLNPDDPQNRKNADSITEDIYRSIKLAKKNIKIISPYYFLYPEQLAILAKWVSEDPERTIQIFGNSVYSADNMMDQALTDHIVGPALMNGFPYAKFGTEKSSEKPFIAPKSYLNITLPDGTIWNNSRGQIQMLAMGAAPEAGQKLAQIGKLHEKSYIIDDYKVIVGTSNQDPRSMNENAEVGVHIEDKYDNGVHDALLADAKTLFQGATIYGSTQWQQVRDDKLNRFKKAQCDAMWHLAKRKGVLGNL